MLKQFGILLSVVLLTACKKDTPLFDTQGSHSFYVRNNNVDLPVLVEGNTSSRTFILYVHGGPETGGIAESGDPVFWNKLEELYAVVYYDQRGIGMSNGSFDESALTVEQSVDDLDKIITVLKNNYGNDISLFLMGGSWGGYLGTAYITTSNNQNKLKGWIEIGGAHNMILLQKELPEQIKQVAQQQINKDLAEDEWQIHLDYAMQYDTNDVSFENWLNLIQQYGPITQQLQKDGELTIRDTDVEIPTGVNLLTLLANDNLNQTGIKLLKQYYNTSLTPNLAAVTLPSRFFWGEYDFASPTALALDAYTNIGTPVQDKAIKIFDHADHSILLTKPEELLLEIKLFVEAYK